MSWVRIDDAMPTHPKMLGLSDKAFRVWMKALCWCSKHETDGIIPKAAFTTLRCTLRVAVELVEAGLWEKAGDDWKAHDYLRYQPSREQKERERTVTAERQARFRQSRNAVTPPERNAVSNGDVTPYVTGAPSRPVPTRPDPNQPAAVDPKDLPGSARAEAPPATAAAGLGLRSERFQQKTREKGQPPDSRHDPLGERFPIADWGPSRELLAWAKEQGLADRDVTDALTELRDKVTGWHDVSFWDLKARRFLETAIERKRKPPGLLRHQETGGRGDGNERKAAPASAEIKAMAASIGRGDRHAQGEEPDMLGAVARAGRAT